MSTHIPEVVRSAPLHGIVRIDVGLEGDWSGSVVTVWTRDSGLIGFDRVKRSHPVHKPSLELYFDRAWVGVHCFRNHAGRNVFDEDLAEDLVGLVESRIGP